MKPDFQECIDSLGMLIKTVRLSPVHLWQNQWFLEPSVFAVTLSEFFFFNVSDTF